ncbi:39S ribosomal protein L41, mitochondrial, partial [Pseudolycoriella hygida]
KFLLYNKRGTRDFKEKQRTDPHPDIPIDKRGVKDTGYNLDGVYYEIPEKIPQLIVPDLTGCKLKPKKIIEDFKNNKLNEDGSPVEPSEEELLDAETAFIRARQTGSDIF